MQCWHSPLLSAEALPHSLPDQTPLHDISGKTQSRQDPLALALDLYKLRVNAILLDEQARHVMKQIALQRNLLARLVLPCGTASCLNAARRAPSSRSIVCSRGR